jgi:ABC-type Fe3+-hydroxamate transport system substrate-binding protein
MLFTDQLNRKIEIHQYPPKRIISLVPSITELLVELGLENELVGITKFCIHPEKIFRSKEKIGGTKNLNIEKIKHLRPDLIIGNKEENVKEQIEEIARHFPVWMSDVNTYEDAIKMIKEIGQLTDRSEKASHLISEIENEFTKLTCSPHILKNKRVIYLIWYRPYMAVGNNTYIHDILNKIHCINACSNQSRYFEISMDEIKKLSPDYVLLSSEPFPFNEKHKTELESYLPDTCKVLLIDAEVFSWYGTKMKYLPDYLLRLKE